MKPSKKYIQKWIIALRSGQYKQQKGCLQGDEGYCCLGVACDIFIPKWRQRRDDENHLVGSIPEHQSYSPHWLRYIRSDFSERTGRHLEELNDNFGCSFNEIADLLQLVYIEDAL